MPAYCAREAARGDCGEGGGLGDGGESGAEVVVEIGVGGGDRFGGERSVVVLGEEDQIVEVDLLVVREVAVVPVR